MLCSILSRMNRSLQSTIKIAKQGCVPAKDVSQLIMGGIRWAICHCLCSVENFLLELMVQISQEKTRNLFFFTRKFSFQQGWFGEGLVLDPEMPWGRPSGSFCSNPLDLAKSMEYLQPWSAEGVVLSLLLYRMISTSMEFIVLKMVVSCWNSFLVWMKVILYVDMSTRAAHSSYNGTGHWANRHLILHLRWSQHGSSDLLSEKARIDVPSFSFDRQFNSGSNTSPSPNRPAENKICLSKRKAL